MEWQLNPRVCQTVFNRLDCLHVDLFASRFNNQLQLIFLSGADHQALRSFILDKSGLLPFAFPPVALIPVVLLKLSKTQSCLLLLVVSLLPRHLWFRRLPELMVPEQDAS